MITAELDTSTIELTNSTDNVALDNANIITGYDNSYNVDIEDLSDLDITVAKKEYTIVGDDIYIPQLYDDAPQWMKDLVGLVVDVSMTTNSTKLINDMNAMLQKFAVSYVPLNQYTQSILDLGDEDMRLNALIETLNSNYNNGLSNANAQIINLQMTKASKDEVLAQIIQTLAAELTNPDSNLGATVVRLEQAIVTEQTARARSFEALTASMESIDGSIAANAEVLETALAYVGIDKAGGSTGTGLLADISILQKQNDGVIETITGTYDVMLGVENPNNNTSNDELDVTKEPYKSWRDADAIAGGIENRAMHVGDVYIKYSTAEHGYKTYERAYKFIRTSVDNTSPYSTDAEGFTWALIVDTDAQNAYVAALNALDLADNKRRVFTMTPSGPYDKGDLWTKATARGSVLYRANTDRTSGFLATEWTEADDAALKDFEATVYEPKISMLETQIDSQISYFYNHVATTTTQVTTQLNTWKSTWTTPELKAAHHGDIGIFTKIGTGGEAYAYSRGTDSWILITDNAILKALMSAATAQATADGVVVSFYAIKQDTAPATTSLWLNKTGTKVLKKYTTSWENVAVKLGDTLTAYDPVTKDTSIYVYNGTGWITNTENGIVAGSEAITTLTANLATTNTTVGGHATQLNTVDTRIANGVASVETKWAYNSVVNINGVYNRSGFGLSTNYTSGSGTQANPYTSEFWIDATKLRFTNSANTGRTAPFTIDASGTTPQITFNGKVSFSNVTGAPGGGSNLLYNSAPMLANETKGWSVSWYNTGIAPVLGAGFDPWRPSGGGSVYAAVPGAPTVGTVFDVAQTTKVPVIGGTWYEASAYTSSHRCTSYVTIAWFDSSGTYITEVGGSQTAIAGGGALSNWSRSTLLAQAPANAARALFYVRSAVSGTDPYCFVAFAYLGKAVPGQVVFSDWSEGTSAGVSSGEVVNDINNGNTTTIDGGRITTGSITAGQIQANSITAREIQTNSISADRLTSTNGQSTVWTGGGLVSANFNGNVNGNIGSPTQGFRLSSNAAGTSADPNVYGAYIKASTMEFLYAGIPGTGNSGRFNYSATASGGAAVMLVSPTYGSGYADNRITSLQNSIITITVTIPYGLYAIGRVSPKASSAGYIQRSINGNAYTDIASQSASVKFTAEYQEINISGNFVITYKENLENLGNFDTLSYRASGGGTIMVTLNN